MTCKKIAFEVFDNYAPANQPQTKSQRFGQTLRDSAFKLGLNRFSLNEINAIEW